MKKIDFWLIGVFISTILFNFSRLIEGFHLLIPLLILFFYIPFFLIGGYFYFKPKEDVKKWRFLAIINGLFIAIALFSLFGKFIETDVEYYLVVLTIPLAILTITKLITLLKQSYPKENKTFIRRIVVCNLIIFTISFSLAITPTITFGKIFFGENSFEYYSLQQKETLENSEKFQKSENFDEASRELAIGLERAKRKKDYSSSIYQELVIDLAYVKYRSNHYELADSLLNSVIENYNDVGANVMNYIQKYIHQYNEAVYTLALLKSSQGYYRISDSLFQISLNYYNDPLTKGYIYNQLGENQQAKLNYQKSDSLLLISISYHKKSGFKDMSSYLNSLTVLAENKVEQQQFASADSIIRIAKNYAKSTFGNKHQEYAYILDAERKLYMNKADYSNALKNCKESLQIKKNVFGTKNSDYLYTTLDLANLHLLLSNFKEAKEIINKNKKIIESNYKKEQPISTYLYDVLYEFNENIMEYNVANEYAIKSVNGRIEWSGDFGFKTGKSFLNYASSNYYLGNYKLADSLYNLSLDIYNHYLGMESDWYVTALNGLALVYIEQDSLETAEYYIDYCIKITYQNLGDKHPEYATLLKNKASIKVLKNNLSEAETLLNQSLNILNTSLGEKNIKTADTYIKLGELEEKKENYRASINFTEKGLKSYKNSLGNEHFYCDWLENRISALTLKADKSRKGK
jgi:hypothetical protein